MRHSSILIVEDEKEIAYNLSYLMTQEGFFTEVAATKEEALNRIGERNFDLVLIDLMLPDGSGYSVCTAIRHRKDIPVIFLTALGDEASIVTGFDLGAYDYITKPVLWTGGKSGPCTEGRVIFRE